MGEGAHDSLETPEKAQADQPSAKRAGDACSDGQAKRQRPRRSWLSSLFGCGGKTLPAT